MLVARICNLLCHIQIAPHNFDVLLVTSPLQSPRVHWWSLESTPVTETFWRRIRSVESGASRAFDQLVAVWNRSTEPVRPQAPRATADVVPPTLAAGQSAATVKRLGNIANFVNGAE